jgi:hypothetical protein
MNTSTLNVPAPDWIPAGALLTLSQVARLYDADLTQLQAWAPKARWAVQPAPRGWRYVPLANIPQLTAIFQRQPDWQQLKSDYPDLAEFAESA